MKSSLKFWQAVCVIGILLSVTAFYQVVQQSNTLGIAVFRSKWVILLGLYVLSALTCAYVLFLLTSGRASVWLERLEFEKTSGWGWQVVGGLTLIAGVVAVYTLRAKVFLWFIPQSTPSLWLMLWLALIATAFFKAGTQRPWAILFALTLLVQGAALAVVDYSRAVSTYPFTLGWSETSRFYYASLVFARHIYGQDVPLSFLHPTRYFMQSLPFLVDGLPVAAHRLWQVILWLGCSALTGFLFARRLKLASRLNGFLVGMWFALLLLYVGVYYHLQVMIWIVLLGVSARHPWRSWIAVMLASFWAGMSRINWFPVPAMLAIALYLIEEPVSNSRNFFRYLSQPVLWTAAGLLAALASQSFYAIWSGNGNNLEAFGSSFTSDLLVERLWPNATYPPGIVPALMLVAAPLLAIVFHYFWQRWRAWRPIRLFGLGAMLLVLLAGGLVVSIKIGGGGDLHNMDAFMVMLGAVAVMLLCDRGLPDDTVNAYVPSVFLVLISILILVSGFMPMKPKAIIRDNAVAWQDIQTIQTLLSDATYSGEEVLFINQRHLLSGNIIKNVPLVPEYEVVSLMEMAMSGNTAYLEQFYRDLRAHRFAYIVASGLYPERQPDNYPFAAENNAWAEKVARPLLCEYQVVQSYQGDVILLAPREVSACP